MTVVREALLGAVAELEAHGHTIDGPNSAAWIVRDYADRITATRPWTDDVPLEGGGNRMTVKRGCNGCGRELGDATEEELAAAILGDRLPDVRAECRCGDGCEET